MKNKKKTKNKINIFQKIGNYVNKSGMFSKVIVIFCILYCVRIIEWGMYQFEMSNTEASTLITAGLTLFGGELLLLCIKRVFSKNDNTKLSQSEMDSFTGDKISSTVSDTDHFDEEAVG